MSAAPGLIADAAVYVPPPPPSPVEQDNEEPGPLFIVTREALADGGVLGTMHGVAALQLAALIDRPRGQSGSAIAALYKAYTAAVDRSLGPEKPVEQPLNVVQGIFS